MIPDDKENPNLGGGYQPKIDRTSPAVIFGTDAYKSDLNNQTALQINAMNQQNKKFYQNYTIPAYLSALQQLPPDQASILRNQIPNPPILLVGKFNDHGYLEGPFPDPKREFVCPKYEFPPLESVLTPTHSVISIGGISPQGEYNALPDDTMPDKAIIRYNGQNLIKHIQSTPFGTSQWYEVIKS